MKPPLLDNHGLVVSEVDCVVALIYFTAPIYFSDFLTSCPGSAYYLLHISVSLSDDDLFYNIQKLDFQCTLTYPMLVYS